MKLRLLLILTIILSGVSGMAQKVTIEALNQPAAAVFRIIMEQTGKNFVYSSDILNDLNITVKATNRPLDKVLSEIFSDTNIEYKIKGHNVILKRRQYNLPKAISSKASITTIAPAHSEKNQQTKILENVEVISRLESPAVETSEIGAKKITVEEVRNVPVLFGESDVIKALQTQPGVTEGTEGMAGMHVHGGNNDQNLYMLDNVPLYQVNHFAGLFSAFNTDIIRYIDFFKSSFPAKYDGRLSSFMDVRTQNGDSEGHHGTAKLGLTSGAFNLSGPLGERTTYLLALRRSWYDVLSVPALAIVNIGKEEKTRFHYYFMDLNAKISHKITNRAIGVVSVYFGDDMLRTGTKFDFNGIFEDDKYDFHWGNLLIQGDLNYRLKHNLSLELTGAFTRYFSSIGNRDFYRYSGNGLSEVIEEVLQTRNSINDWIARGDFDWQPNDNSHIRFGANYVRHSFLPSHVSRMSKVETTKIVAQDSTRCYGANEANVYIEDDWRISEKIRINVGVHTSLFDIDNKIKYGLSPRFSLSYHPKEPIALKAAYSRTTQYVHQLSQSYLSLPTDQWIPIMGNFK